MIERPSKHARVMLSALLCGGLAACTPPVTPIAVQCGAGTLRDPQTQTCTVEAPEANPCGPGTRLDAEAQVCVGAPTVIECGPGAAWVDDGQTCVQSGMRLYCDRGTVRSADRTECVPAPRDVIICGEGTQVGFDQRCAPTDTRVELERVETAPLSFDSWDTQLANETVVHFLDAGNDHVIRVDVRDGAQLDPVIGRLPVRWMQVIAETGDVYLVHEQRIDVFRAATGEMSVFTTTLAPITSVTRIRDTLLVTTGSRVAPGEAEVYSLQTGEREAGWPIGAHGEARGIYVAAHDAVILSRTASFPLSMYRIDLSQEAPQLEEVRRNGERNGPLHYSARTDTIVSRSGQLFDPNTLEFVGGLGMPVVDVLEQGDGLYALTAAEVYGNRSGYLVVQDALGNRLSETRIGDGPRALFMIAGQLHVVARADDHLQILRLR